MLPMRQWISMAARLIGGRQSGIDPARFRSLTAAFNWGINSAALLRFWEHIAMFNECARLHLNNELRQ